MKRRKIKLLDVFEAIETAKIFTVKKEGENIVEETENPKLFIAFNRFIILISKNDGLTKILKVFNKETINTKKLTADFEVNINYVELEKIIELLPKELDYVIYKFKEFLIYNRICIPSFIANKIIEYIEQKCGNHTCYGAIIDNRLIIKTDEEIFIIAIYNPNKDCCEHLQEPKKFEI